MTASTTSHVRVARLCRDPELRRLFALAERDLGGLPVLPEPAPRPVPRIGAAALELVEA